MSAWMRSPRHLRSSARSRAPRTAIPTIAAVAPWPRRSIAATAQATAAEWRALAPDIIHINKQNLEDALDLLRAAPLGRIPGICTIHLTQTARYLGARLAWVRDAVARRALAAYPGTLVTVLDQRRLELAQFLGSEKRLRTIITGIPLPDAGPQASLREAKRAELGLAETDLLVIGVGRLVPQKRPLLFLEIAATTAALRSDLHFLWVGDGPLAGNWDRTVRERSLGATIHRVGWQSEVAPFLAAADLLLHVAEFEGLPLALLEAMAAGLPCALTENLRAELPFLRSAEPFPAQPAEAWLAALGDRARLRARGTAARLLVERQFSFERMAREYEEAYAEALASSKAS